MFSRDKLTESDNKEYKGRRVIAGSVIAILGTFGVGACSSAEGVSPANSSESSSEQAPTYSGTTGAPEQMPPSSSDSISMSEPTPSVDATTDTTEPTETSSGSYVPGELKGPDAEFDDDALGQLDPVNNEDFKKFKPMELDGSSPEALLKSYDYDFNCFLNDLRPNVVKECIRLLTGSNPDDTSNQLMDSIKATAARMAEYRTVFLTYRQKAVSTLLDAKTEGDTTVLTVSVKSADTAGSSDTANVILSFRKSTDSKTVLFDKHLQDGSGA